jgi:hypothetical protein
MGSTLEAQQYINISRFKRKMIISIDVKQVFEKIQYPFNKNKVFKSIRIDG